MPASVILMASFVLKTRQVHHICGCGTDMKYTSTVVHSHNMQLSNHSYRYTIGWAPNHMWPKAYVGLRTEAR